MKLQYKKNRIYIIPENEDDVDILKSVVPKASEVLCFYTTDAGTEGNERGLVVTTKASQK